MTRRPKSNIGSRRAMARNRKVQEMASPSRRLSLSFQGRSSSAATKQVGQFQMLETIGEGQYGERA
jgi:hypothetical protein